MSHELKQANEAIQLFHDILHCYQLHEGNPKGEILSGIVKRLEYGNLILDLNRAEALQLFHDILHCYQLHEGNPKGVELRTEEQHKFCVKVRENLTQTISNIENIMTTFLV